MKKTVIVLVLLAAAVGVGGWYYVKAGSQPIGFRTVQVERGDLLTTIDATGTIEPEEVVDVGAQVAGQIIRFGEDPRSGGKKIDYGSPVEKDTVLARIDPSLYAAQVDQSKAALDQAEAQVASAKANIERAEADLGQMKAKVYQAQRDYERVKRMRPARAVADVDYDTAEATYRTNKATLGVGEATLAQNKAALKDAEANAAKAKAALKNAEINLAYCTIKSPVKGVIVDRRVNVGQTVVSSLNAPSLFLIAKDLKRLQVWASVNEADIGNVHSGQEVTFTVDAFPGKVFKGVVAPDQPRLNASMTQNVVTYTVVVRTDNPDGKLLPYLTANLRFQVDKRSNVLLVPNTALRYKPDPQAVVPEARGEYLARRNAKGPGGDKTKSDAAPRARNRGTLWVEDGGFVRPVKVQTGLSNGLMTEIVAGEIKEGDAVVIGENRSSGGGTSNPFTPKLFNKKQ